MRIIGAPIAAALVFATVALATVAHAAGGARAAIEKQNAALGEAIGKKDAAAVAAFYTEDALVLPPGAGTVKGRKAIEEFWKKTIDGGLKAGELTTVDVGETGDAAWETGKFLLTVQPEGKEAVKQAGKYVVVWKKEKDGQYRLHRDIWNTPAE
jgi:uncharacterized protein (TIGR02246 family)